MYNPRDIAEIEDQIKLALVNQGSSLSDISEGSVLSALIRSFAGSHQKQELFLKEIISSFYVRFAEKSDLDLKAQDESLQRKPGEIAKGSILAKSDEGNIFLTNQSILTDPITGIQVRVELTGGSNLSTNTEVAIPVFALIEGERGNLKAGTRLITPAYSAGNFLVGTHRTSTGEVCGDLEGGLSPESDVELRQRIINYSISKRKTTEEAIRNSLLQEPSIKWVSVISKPGLINVWVDSPNLISNTEIVRLTEAAGLVKAAGTVLSVNQATRFIIDVNVFIKPNKLVNLQALTDTVVGVTKNYIQSLPLEGKFELSTLTDLIYRLDGVLEARVDLPSVDIFPGNFSIIRAEKIIVSYDTV